MNHAVRDWIDVDGTAPLREGVQRGSRQADMLRRFSSVEIVGMKNIPSGEGVGPVRDVDSTPGARARVGDPAAGKPILTAKTHAPEGDLYGLQAEGYHLLPLPSPLVVQKITTRKLSSNCTTLSAMLGRDSFSIGLDRSFLRSSGARYWRRRAAPRACRDSSLQLRSRRPQAIEHALRPRVALLPSPDRRSCALKIWVRGCSIARHSLIPFSFVCGRFPLAGRP